MRRLIVLLLAIAALPLFAGTGKIVIVNNDAPGVGFNDPTPRTPIAGNNGTTLGEQRMNVFLAAAEGWHKYIDTNVDIIASASFRTIAGCTDTSGILGQAAPNSWRENFPGAPQANVFYPIALANKFAGGDLEPGIADIFVQFNAAVDNASCLGTSSWYYGFDGNEGNDIDLYTVVMHELGHGLGIAGAAAAPDFLGNHPSISDTHTFDRTLGLRWDQMTVEQRRVSMINTGNLVWDGALTRGATARYLDPLLSLTLTEPSAVARNYDIGFADFGPDVSKTALSGRLVRAIDEANADGQSTADGCTAFTNADAIRGNIAFVDRGSCTFVAKARNAVAAGATGVVIGDRSESYNAANPATCLPPGMHGENASDITIPILSVGINDANGIRGVAVDTAMRGLLRTDPTQRAGASIEGYARLYAPCVVQPGSSLHHFDVTASPNLLMEPAINSDLPHTPDLTLHQLLDMGWTSRSGRQFLTR